MAITDRLKHAWNAFLNKDPTIRGSYDIGPSSSSRPDRVRLLHGYDRSLVASILNRIAMDTSQIAIKHVILDERGRYLQDKDSGLNNCLTLEANKDQTGRAFMLDAVQSMLDDGCVALVPIDTDYDITDANSFDIKTIRTGKVLQWYPDHVRVRVYNDRTGMKEEIVVPKKSVAIVENPLYSVMNEPNSTLKRLIHKLDLLDVIDEQQGAGKLDMIIQLPYIIKTDARKAQAEKRRKDIEDQLTSSKYGIAYTDGTEHITQLNRSVDNQIMSQVEYLTNLLYSQLGITAEILNGSADDKVMSNYYTRTIEPIIAAFADEMRRKFLTKTARTQHQSIEFFRDPFKLVPVSAMADIADKFTRNEILTANEVRQIVGMAPSGDPNADALRNKNISASGEATQFDVNGNPITVEGQEVAEPGQEQMSVEQPMEQQPME